MYVNRLSSVGPVVWDPTWEQIEDALVHIAGEGITDVALESSDKGGQMIVAGDPRVGFIVFASFPDGRSYALTDPTRGPEPVVASIGGQEAEYEAWMFVGREEAISAVRRFTESGEIDPSLNWNS